MATTERAIGTRDVQLQSDQRLIPCAAGAGTYTQYVAAAERASDHDLAKFFRQVQEEDRHRADQAKILLQRRLSQE